MTFRERLGVIGFFLTWPLFYIYLNHTQRTRVVVVYQGKVLVVKNWVSSGGWLLPGGGIKRHEQPAVGAVRELQEETGIALPPEKLLALGTGEYAARGLHDGSRCFAVKLEAEPVLKRLRLIVAEMRWIEPDQVTAETANPETFRALELLRSDHPDFLLQ